ncbi:MAG: hypothetical protein BGO13_06815 [Burkholderiales bacterium 66-5]|nr:MAG: hypothetical protein BGO13_06815 [Burkholderiales bacterium 66-5]
MNAGGSEMALPSGRFEGREAFRQLVRDAMACAARAGWRELVLSDADFADWPLGERAVIESLRQWSAAGRRMTLLAGGFDAIVRLHPRFVQWRVQWDHLVTARKSGSVNATDLPSVLWSERWVLQRLDPVRSNGVSGSEPARLVLQRELLDEWVLARSAPGFPASVLGL